MDSLELGSLITSHNKKHLPTAYGISLGFMAFIDISLYMGGGHIKLELGPVMLILAIGMI